MSKEEISLDDNQDVSVENNQDFYSGYSPLDEPVKERAYTTPNINSSNLDAELEEPTFNAPNFEDFDSEAQEPNSFNPAVENLDKKEQLYATEQMVDTVLDVYDKAHILGNRAVKLKEDKIAKAMEDGEISPSLEVPIDDRGNTLSLLNYVQEYNKQLDDAIKLDDEFVEKVRPAMIRVFQKRGIAMTDEQFLAVAFGSDIITKGAIIFQLTRQNKQMMNLWKEQSMAIPKQKPAQPSTSSTTPSTPPSPTPSEPVVVPANDGVKENVENVTQTPTPVFQEPEEFTASSMVSDMMGGNDSPKFKNSKEAEGMPQFGDPEILNELNKLAKQDKVIEISSATEETEVKPKRKRGRPRKNKN